MGRVFSEAEQASEEKGKGRGRYSIGTALSSQKEAIRQERHKKTFVELAVISRMPMSHDRVPATCPVLLTSTGIYQR